ncbi:MULTISPECIES: hypothetical protein [unclassified Pseudomonas]|uniref:hypothetical protein n=1 Tax=unclassified Pseudomonas TaxID=196821 RepID=UPI000A1EC9AD|nr:MULTISPECIES: hypothetical protein [unclassified Pseudomonas]
MKLIYSTQNSDFDPEKRYRNPVHFDRPEAGVKQVVVMGDWPKVVSAYEAVGVDVSVVKPLSDPAVDTGSTDFSAELQEAIDKLNAERDGVVRLIEAAEGKSELEHPGAGELPIRLFDALNAIRESFESLKAERGSLAGEAESLRAEVARLKASSDQSNDSADKIAALKAQLDAAGVQYRANASVESLEKAVADLPKA